MPYLLAFVNFNIRTIFSQTQFSYEAVASDNVRFTFLLKKKIKQIDICSVKEKLQLLILYIEKVFFRFIILRM